MSKHKSGVRRRRGLPTGAPGTQPRDEPGPERTSRGETKRRTRRPPRQDADPVATAPAAAAPRTVPVHRPATSFGSDAIDLYVVCAPGIEAITAHELRELRIPVTGIEPGGVTARGSLGDLQRANLGLRTASRVVVRVAEFSATAFHEVERRAKHIPWEHWLGAEPVRLRVTCRKSKLYHSDAVAQRFAEAMAKRTGARLATGAADADEEGADAQMFTVRLVHDRCTVSADSSGALLHKRGYRLAVAKAPLRETLGAAMLLASRWDGSTPLLDPFCGSGTIPIEGALIARRIAPGIGRGFSFMRWPSFDEGQWATIVAAARERELPRAAAAIAGSDRDEGAIAAALANAARAGVSGDVEFSRRSISGVEPPPGPGLVATNPPYGMRAGSPDVRDLYAQIGKVVRDRLQGWRIGLLSADHALDAQLRLPLEGALEISNGGIPVRYMVGTIPIPMPSEGVPATGRAAVE